MADSVEVNYEAIELAYSLSVFNNRADYTRAIAYEEDFDDEPFRTAMDYWSVCGESAFRGFLLLHECVMILLGEHSDENDNQQGSEFRLEETRKQLPNGQKPQQEEIELRSILRTSHNSDEQLQIGRNTHRKQSRERKTKGNQRRHNCSISTGSRLANRSRHTTHDNVNVPLCDSESDLTTTEDENEVVRSRPRQLDIRKTHGSQLEVDSDSLHFRPHKVNIQFEDQLDSSVELIESDYPMLSVSRERFERAKHKLKEVQLLLTKDGHMRSRGSQIKQVDFYRLSLVSAILNCVDDATQGVIACKRLVTELNSLTLVQGTLTRALETPRGWKQRLTKRLHGRKWDKMFSLVHYINYMTRKWMVLAGVQEGTGQTMGIPTIDTTHGPVHPTDDWCVRDKCQTCVEFVGKIPHACAIATNSKDEIVMIDSRNYVTVYTIEGKALLTFKASTSRHPHARWIMGIDDDDNLYVGSAVASISDSKHPLSIFTSTGTLLSEPELTRVCRGRYHFYAVTKSGVILTLTIGTHKGNLVTLHTVTRNCDTKLISSFAVREIALPRIFNASNESITVGGVTESKDFAFQVFDHSGQQLYFYKPEVNFQYCQMDPWTGSLVLVTTSALRDYRYCLCKTVMLTGQVCILATNGQTIQSCVNLRWPFRKVAGVTLLRSGLVVLVTIDEPYYAIHVI